MAPASAAEGSRESGAAQSSKGRKPSRSRSPLRRKPDLRKPAEPANPPKGRSDNQKEGTDKQAKFAVKSKPPQQPESVAGKVPSRQFQGSLYGSWTHSKEDLGDRPRCLHLFSGPQRPGDLAEQLKAKGWAVCSVDLKQPHPTDLLDQGVRQRILKDVREKRYDHVFLGTPCETYSALREQQPGPRPIVQRRRSWVCRQD